MPKVLECFLASLWEVITGFHKIFQNRRLNFTFYRINLWRNMTLFFGPKKIWLNLKILRKSLLIDYLKFEGKHENSANFADGKNRALWRQEDPRKFGIILQLIRNNYRIQNPKLINRMSGKRRLIHSFSCLGLVRLSLSWRWSRCRRGWLRCWRGAPPPSPSPSPAASSWAERMYPLTLRYRGYIDHRDRYLE